uniref:Fork-head domain-containing protein n=2 Tax=Neogobius melanostomus TaxID=47308 RepID=A0A8C6T104_9GOBI
KSNVIILISACLIVQYKTPGHNWTPRTTDVTLCQRANLKMVNLGSQLPAFVPTRHLEHFLKSTTYLAKIALILQNAPDKMLTFSQLLYRLAPLIPEPKKSVEGNIRVCLSSNNCFVKVPMKPGSQDSKKNYWKLDTQQITGKMVRRHFRGILEVFPELVSKVQPPSRQRPSVSSAEPAACKREVKFSSPFSIESILRRDSPYVQTPRPSPLSVPCTAEQQPGQHLFSLKRFLFF